MGLVKTIKASWDINLRVPMVPNFILENANTLDSDLGKYPVSDFPEEVLRAIGEAWTENLIARAAEMRKERKP